MLGLASLVRDQLTSDSELVGLLLLQVYTRHTLATWAVSIFSRACFAIAHFMCFRAARSPTQVRTRAKFSLSLLDEREQFELCWNDEL